MGTAGKYEIYFYEVVKLLHGGLINEIGFIPYILICK
jgi:hypothetical protein